MQIGDKVYIENPICGLVSATIISIDLEGGLAIVRRNKGAYWSKPVMGNQMVPIKSIIPSMKE